MSDNSTIESSADSFLGNMQKRLKSKSCKIEIKKILKQLKKIKIEKNMLSSIRQIQS